MRKRSSLLSPRRMLLGLLLLAFVGTCSCRQSSHPAQTPAPPKLDTQPLRVEEPAAKTGAPPDVRVAVLKDAPRVTVAGRDCAVFFASGKLFKRYTGETALEVRPLSAGLQVNGEAVPGGSGISIESGIPSAWLRVENQETSPRVIVYRSAAALTAVAQMDLEDYLAGVLAGEVPFEKWHPEALRAQAIASRTYAYYQTRKNAAEPYDVECTVMSQVFKSGCRNNPILNSAVKSTRGLVLTWNGAAFPAYFHSTCGGQTSGAAAVFPEQPACKPLCGAACAFCSASPHYRWRCVLRKSVIAEKLKLTGVMQRILSVEFLDARGEALGGGKLGRAVQVRVRHERGTVSLSGNQFRLQAGPKDLKSLLIDQVIDRGEALEISGGGFGHGAGLCQYGSQGMAAAGYPHTVILGAYYPGASLTRLYY